MLQAHPRSLVSSGCTAKGSPPRQRHGLTLLEVMIAMFLMATFMLGFLDTFLHARRLAEESVMEAASTTVVTGLVEQMKMLDFDGATPITATDTDQALFDAFPGTTAKSAPYLRVRLNQEQTTWLMCVNNLNTAVSQAPSAPPTSLAALDPALRNTIGPIPLSNTAGAKSQPLTLDLWVWVDHISGNDVSEARVVTIVYAYEVNTGRSTRTFIRRIAFVRTPFGPRNRQT